MPMNNTHHIERLDLNLLKVFDAIYQEGHLGRAAQRLFITPSAVSHSLRRLREHFGDALFVRDGRAMLPTPLCQRLAPDLRTTLDNLRATLRRAGQFDPAKGAHVFTVGVPEKIEPLVLPRLQQLLHRDAPQAQLHSLRFSRDSLSRDLGTGRLQLAIDVARPVDDPLRHQRLTHGGFSVVLRANHPHAGGMTQAQYLSGDHVVVSGRREGLVLEDYSLKRQGLARKVVVRCQSYLAAVQLVAQSDVLLTMPQLLADNLTQGLAVCQVPLPLVMADLELDLYWHINAEQDPANRWFRHVIQQQLMTLIDQPSETMS